MSGAVGRGAVLIDAIAAFLRRYVVLSQAQADAVALWIVHSFCIEAAEATPYLAITSAEKRSGKSRLLEVLALLVARPLRAAGATEAALFRSLSAERPPTLLMDEVDAIFGAKVSGSNEGLRALLNAGHRRGAGVLRCVGERSQRVEEFAVFGPKALAGIGRLPDTIADRSLPVRLKRRARSERLERLRERDAAPEALALRERAEQFALDSIEALRLARPELPDELDDRAQDACEPLVAIADLAGADWPERARQALVSLRGGGQEAEDGSLGVRLLADVALVFAHEDKHQLPSSELLEALAAIEEAPWGDLGGTGPLRPRRLASLLKPYGIHPRDLRVGDRSCKGYRREDFADAFARYVPMLAGATSSPPSRDIRDTPVAEPVSGESAAATSAGVSRQGASSQPVNQADVADVAAGEHEGGACRYASHRPFDWVAADGSKRCSVCHPPVNGRHGEPELAR